MHFKYRASAFILGLLLVPLIAVFGVFSVSTAPELIIRGTLNLKGSQVYDEIDPLEFYIDYLLNLFSGDFGVSLSSGASVLPLVSNSMSVSFSIVVVALCFATFIAVSMTVLSFRSSGRAVNSIILVLSAVPLPAAVYIFGFLLEDLFVNWPRYAELLVASLALCMFPTFLIFGALSSGVRRFEKSDAALFSRACGQSKWHVWKRYGFREVLLSFVGVLENVLIYMFAFLFFVEAPFSIPGIGLRFVSAIQRFDIPVICGAVTILMATFFLISISVERIIKLLARA